MKRMENNLNPENYNILLSTHPFTCLLHIVFKFSTVFCYIFFRLITQSSVHTFIIVIILSSFDFWITKNLTGRILVGLRWWNGEAEGMEGWFFESRDNFIMTSKVDGYVFWGGQIAYTLFWAILFVLKFLSFSMFWGMLVFICFILGFVNLYGYYQCYQNFQDKISLLGRNFGNVFTN